VPFKLPEYTWGKDRELCKRCKHYSERNDDDKHHSNATIMLCAVNPQKSKRKIGTCIDNRTRGPCGKEGKLFEPMKQGA
jgi:hypothetical protein